MTTTMFFVLLGVTAVTMGLMKLVEWLDTPRASTRTSPRRAVRTAEAPEDLCCAELGLERALHAA